MASRPTRRGDGPSPKLFHELGVKGRKTGAVLRDAGVRDEHGMQPLDDDLFSSPKSTQARPAPAPAPARPAPPQSKKKTPSLPPPPHPEPADDGSEPMDIPSSAGPGPQTVLRQRSSLAQQLPKSRSPPKTNLRSPAKRNPNVIHSDSPARKSASKQVGNAPVPRVLFSPKSQRQAAGRPGLASTTRPIEYADNDDDDDGAFDGGLNIDDMVDESIVMMNTMRTDPQEAPSEQWGRPAHSTPMSAVGKGKQKASAPSPALPSDPPVGLGLREDSRVSREPSQARTQPTASRFSTMKRPALEAVPENEVSAYRAAKKQKSVEPAPVKRGRGRPPLNPGAPKRGRGRPRKGESAAPRPDERDETYVEVQRGPPLPKSRGLVSFRQSHSRPNTFAQRPADWWRGERGGSEEAYDDGAIIHRNIPRGSPRESRRSRTREPDTEEEELEDWEQEDDGLLSANVMAWNAEYELDPSAFDGELEEVIAPIAVSARGLISKPYKEGGYAYATAMRERFMSAGVVDLPPGAVKRQKPSQDMHLVFFVHHGKALVTVNETTFHISKGGMWFVPRQNTYSIANDSTTSCRVFFAQAKELFLTEDSS